MTEYFNYFHMSRSGQGKASTVGHPYQNDTVRIAEDGEIQLLTPWLMMGHNKNEEATDECVTLDGCLHTRDKGEVHKSGADQDYR